MDVVGISYWLVVNMQSRQPAVKCTATNTKQEDSTLDT